MSNFFNKESITASFGTKQLDQSGALVYEYNPLRVYRVNSDTMMEDSKGEYVVASTETSYITVNNINYAKYSAQTTQRYSYYPKNSIIDLDTTNLTFDLEHPVDIIPQQSYDGSTNLILDDGLHTPKLINSRFSSTGMNTYQIVDREGDNDTNIYDDSSFDTDVSLYKKVNDIVKLKFVGLSTSGNLKIGNYVFYFKLADSDGNETDFIAESGIVSCHIGNLNDPFSIRGGLEDENSFKSVNFILSNIDSSYNYVMVYYTRSTGTQDGTETTTAAKVSKKFNIYNNIAKVTITGFESIEKTSVNDINTGYQVVESAQAQATCQNMLFLGNIENPNIEYKELADLSLRFLPQLNVTQSIGKVDENYQDSTGGYEYYNAENIYNKLGYWNDEIYRFAVVYILNDYTLSPAFNVRGIKELTKSSTYDDYPVCTNGVRNYIPIDKETYRLNNANENSKGVVKISYSDNQLDTKTIPIGLNFKINSAAVTELKKYTKGFFFVRQKRNKTTFCQAVTIGLDIVSHLPILPTSYNTTTNTSTYLAERFLDDGRILTHDFDRRIYSKYTAGQVLSGYAALCPEYEVNQGYFNQFFTASDFVITKPPYNFKNKYFDRSGAYLYNLEYQSEEDKQQYNCTITSVADDIKIIKGKSQLFSSRAGEAAEATKLAYCGYKNKTTESNNLLRGSYGPYIGVEGYSTFPLSIVNIKIPNYDSNAMDSYFEIRYRDSSSFHAISDRISWNDVTAKVDSTESTYNTPTTETIYKISNIFRGDCYICNFTHRMCRNFQDSETPTNDEIVEKETWYDHYEIGENDSEEERGKINRGDVNAVKIGHWVTIKVCSNINLSLRCTDPFYTTETGLTGRVRAFYPLRSMDTCGEGKIPESALSNGGLNKSISDRFYYEQPDVPAIKNKFHTRVIYSDISINDAYKNGYRVFRDSNFRDYPLTYGNIVKLVEWSGNLICVFEHGVAAIAVNERAVAGRGTGGNVFINTSKVLPENPNILSSTFGSQWADSVVKTPYGVYGIDTVAKKIWKVQIEGSLNPQFQLTVISDFKVQRFLNENISLTEHETTPILGIRNVKTHYNAFKGDLMFTFYDDINTLEEKVWNLCYNEILGKFITFYSWVPSFSDNIDNVFFSFDRNTSKNLAKLYADPSILSLSPSITSINNITASTETNTVIGTIVTSNINLKSSNYVEEFTDTLDTQIICSIPDNTLSGEFSIANGILSVNTEYLSKCKTTATIWKIPIKATLRIKSQNTTNRQIGYIEQELETTITLASDLFLSSENNTYFWKHGQAGLMKTKGDIKPCYWYDKQHPFEFEIIVVDNPINHKIFTDLQIVSNKANPESLHFEISGEVYNFADDKKNMFFRQEAIKNLYQYNGGDISYDHNYLNITPEQRDIPYSASEFKEKSTEFPIYYSRVDTLNEIEDYYQAQSETGKNYQRISGSEIIYDKLMNQFKIATHIKACPFDKPYRQEISVNRYLDLYSKGYNNIGVLCNKYTKEDGVITELIAMPFSRRNPSDIGVIESTIGTTPVITTGYQDIHYYEIMRYGRLTGNIQYQEDRWYLQIPSITYWQKNEKQWTDNCPPLTVSNNPLPEGMSPIVSLTSTNIPKNLLDLGYKAENAYFDTAKWEKSRKETRIRDKYIRVKIRYSGEDLAVIYALKTLYTISYA